MRLIGLEVGDAQIGADVGVVDAAGNSFVVEGDRLRPLTGILGGVALITGGLRGQGAGLRGLCQFGTQGNISSADA